MYLNNEKMISYLESNKHHLDEWYLNFVESVRKQTNSNIKLSKRQYDFLKDEVKRILFINNLHLFE